MDWLKEEWFVEELNGSNDTEHYHVVDECGFSGMVKTQPEATTEAEWLCRAGLCAVVVHKGKIVWQA